MEGLLFIHATHVDGRCILSGGQTAHLYYVETQQYFRSSYQKSTSLRFWHRGLILSV